MNENTGHRERLDKRVIEQDFEVLKEHEQLEHLLFAVIPRGDTNKIAHRLLEEYGSIVGVFNANPEELMKIEGVGRRTAMFLTSLPHLLGIVEHSITNHKPTIIKSTHDKVKFAKTYFYGKMVENAYIVSLSADYQFKRITRLSRGVGKENEAVLFVTDVVKQALCDGASIVFVVHNHPLGDVRPSASDIEITRKLYYAFEGLEIDFDDSIIISGNEYFSMKDKGYIDPAFLEFERTKRMKEKIQKR